jgi:hypothetical protein
MQHKVHISRPSKHFMQIMLPPPPPKKKKNLHPGMGILSLNLLEGLNETVRSLTSTQLFSRHISLSLSSSSYHLTKSIHVFVMPLHKQCITQIVLVIPEPYIADYIFSTVNSTLCYHNVLDPRCMDNKLW